MTERIICNVLVHGDNPYGARVTADIERGDWEELEVEVLAVWEIAKGYWVKLDSLSPEQLEDIEAQVVECYDEGFYRYED